MHVDVLAIGAHPDDVDIGVGGTLLRLHDSGHRVGVLDLTRGELGSRGTPEERDKEAAEAAEMLGVAVRENAKLPDGHLANTPEQRAAVIAAIRALRPKVILSHMKPDRHPDHQVAHDLVQDANFYSGVTRVDAEGEPHRADTIYWYRPYHEDDTAPQFVSDISKHFERKLEALKAYRSQLQNPDYDGPETLVSSNWFWEGIQKRAAYWGYRIGVDYGEPLWAAGPFALDAFPGLEGLK